MAAVSDVRSENSFFTTRVIVSEDGRLFISVDPSDPQRLSILKTAAKMSFALSEATTLEEAEELSCLINAFCRQLVIVLDSSHPLFLKPESIPVVRH